MRSSSVTPLPSKSAVWIIVNMQSVTSLYIQAPGLPSITRLPPLTYKTSPSQVCLYTTPPMHFSRFIISTLLASIPLATMHTLPTPFTIEINGLPIAPPTAGADSPPQATLGTADNAAKFNLKDGVLECEGWMLGRNKTEDRSLLPKKVVWFRVGETEREQVHPVAVEKSGDGEEYRPMFHGAHLQEQDGSVFANLMEETATVQVKMQS
ncbi:hypothetical protein HBH98_001380 [Parastagonospora nodorum]|nr:hypothetical protein HBH52_167930 [Parastagonospora nodorum]KAH4029402.1 hypothetical protein HBI09_132790 [Parastagonospora nodorum]KAH4198126.1 hypothetical protein HBI95_184730 [Parastagonospora nodorum]KAH4353133.1 hypothetical protein HBH98_001380 [Parastagonospora nodorum]KAH4359630.1 hypothetical protein HBH97_211660 [Parastagonospora nodorum]